VGKKLEDIKVFRKKALPTKFKKQTINNLGLVGIILNVIASTTVVFSAHPTSLIWGLKRIIKWCFGLMNGKGDRIDM
jgi:hypothetical protein